MASFEQKMFEAQLEAQAFEMAQAQASGALDPGLVEALSLIGATPPSFHDVSLPQQSSASSSRSGLKTKLCSHWQQFKCNYGDACRFSHAGAGGPHGRGVFPAVARAQAQAAVSENVAAEAKFIADYAAMTEAAAAAEATAANEAATPKAPPGAPRVEAYSQADLLALLARNEDPNANASQGYGGLPYGSSNASPVAESAQLGTGLLSVGSFQHFAQQAFQPFAAEQVSQSAFEAAAQASQQTDLLQSSVQPGFDDAIVEEVEAAIALLQNPIVQRMMAAREATAFGAVAGTATQQSAASSAIAPVAVPGIAQAAFPGFAAFANPPAIISTGSGRRASTPGFQAATGGFHAAPGRPVRGAKAMVCQAFLMGGCNDGERCRFSHDTTMVDRRTSAVSRPAPYLR